ncbi:MAG: UDP-2,3-diacylglucosamine diphosphatase [Porticoccaceae bacterium]|nr:UDP-2,3-diacylglucosamine diphosphatase [Porticoccaceae bacterium]
MSVLFISDLHLAPERPAVTRAFLSFLSNRASAAESLYILGDLFEAWIGDDDPTAMAAEVQDALRKLSDSGVSLFIQQGNRDFLLGQRFIKRCGAALLGDEHIVENNGHRALVMHGDSLCTDDIDYQRFRRKARNPIYKWCLSHLPLKRRQKLAADWRAKSMAANSNKASAIMDVNADAVTAVMDKHAVDILIHGHTHRPNRHQLAKGERIVLGDWHDLGWVLCLDDSGYNLESFVISSQK